MHAEAACLGVQEPFCTREPPRSARDFCRVCEVPAARPGPASPLPRKLGRRSSFHNKSPDLGSGSRSRQEQGPRCQKGTGPARPALS